jgi:polyhydroxybutyrate depolymerase
VKSPAAVSGIFRRACVRLAVGLHCALLALLPACAAPAHTARAQSLRTDTVRTLVHGGIERSYLLHLPPGHDRGVPAAVVLVLHGGGGHAEHMAALTRFNELADEAGFIVVYPNGTGPFATRLLTWNGGACCGYAQRRAVDDVGFLRAVVADLQTLVAVDRRRIYATGLSNGAIMAYRLACEAADLVAAIGPVAGTQNVARCAPTQAVSVLHIHGTDDTHVPFDGGVGADSLTRVDYASVQSSVRFWAERNGCAATPSRSSSADVEHLVYTGCAAGGAVELYSIAGGGHAWPGARGPAWRGGDSPATSIDATRTLWAFFAAHPKP